MRSMLVLAMVAGALQSPVPIEREPTHRLAFQNAFVRVFDAELAARGATAYHTHALDNVAVAILPGRLTVTPLGGAAVSVSIPAGSVSFARGGYTHEGRNIGDTTLRFIDIELRGPRPSVTHETEGAVPHQTAIDNDRVIVRRVVVGPGESVPAHRHAGPLLEVCVRAGGLQGPTPPAAAGATAWRDDGRVPERRNDGTAGIEIVEVEWKP